MLVFADAHVHTNPISGMGVSGYVPRFREYGGWFLAIVSLPPIHYGYDYSIEGYRKSFEIVISECKKARELGVEALCFLGIHPADVEKMLVRIQWSSTKILSLVDQVLKMIDRIIRDGLAHGIGEIGRPHYTTKPEAVVLCNYVMERALEMAKDLDVPVHLHLEQGGYVTVLDIATRVSKLGLKTSKVILHHVDVKTATEAQQMGLIFTVVGKEPVLRECFKRLHPCYMIESDFIDDPKRPGVACYPWQIIEVQKKLLSEGVVDEEYLYKLNVDMVRKVYGVEPRQ